MNKRVLISLLCVSILFVLGGCSTKHIDSKDSQSIENNENLTINSNLMIQLARLGPMYEFVPLKYKGGVVNGIISPIKVEKDIEFRWPQGEHSELEPIIYKEYAINGLDKRSFPIETGSIIKLSEISLYRKNNDNINKIIATGKGKALDKDKVFEANEQLYYIETDGKIYKMIFDGNDVELEIYYDLELGENETLNVSNLYYNNTAVGENIFVEIVTKNLNSLSGTIQYSVLNMKDKARTDISNGTSSYPSIEKIFSKSDDLVLISVFDDNTQYNYVWIARYSDGNFEKLVKIDKWTYSATFNGKEKSIEDILYDDETNSFFIKKLVKIDKKQSYQYEVLKLE